MQLHHNKNLNLNNQYLNVDNNYLKLDTHIGYSNYNTSPFRTTNNQDSFNMDLTSRIDISLVLFSV